MSVFGNHEAALVASMDCAVDDLLDALNDADQLGVWSVPVRRRSADQDEAVIRVQDAQEAVEEYMQLFIADRYGLDSVVQLETGAL